MSAVKKSTATLRIYGDDLVPQDITNILGVQPSRAKIKGEETPGRKTGKICIAKTGMWQLRVADRESEDIDGQIREIFDRIPADVSAWQSITKKYRTNLFCGLFMSETNDGLSISPQSFALLAERGIELWFDIYAPSDDGHESASNTALEPITDAASVPH